MSVYHLLRIKTGSLTLGGLLLLLIGLPIGSAPMAYAGRDTRFSPISMLASGETVQFSVTGSMRVPRTSPTATLLRNGTVLVAGGYQRDPGGHMISLNSAELYDPSTGTWTPTGSMSVERTYHKTTPLSDGKVLVTGGISSGALTNISEIYDPATRTWSPTGNLNEERYNHGAFLLSSGKVLVVGGLRIGGGPPSYGVVPSAELFDPATGTWSLNGGLAYYQTSFAATLLNSGNVLLAGGAYVGYPTPNSAQLFDPATGTSALTGFLNATRYDPTATLLTDGRVLVAGGTYYPSTCPDNQNTVELYNPATGTWSYASNLSFARTNHTATRLTSGKVLIVGGWTTNYTTECVRGYSASVEMYDPAANVWSAVRNMNVARGNHSATLLGNGRILVAGGIDNDGNSLDSAEIGVVVAADTTPPVIAPSVGGTVGANGWYIGNVTVNWNTSDPESGIASSSGCGPTALNADTAGITLTCSATNGVGLTASNSVSVKIDKTAPTLSLPADMTVQGTSAGAPVTYALPTATDNLDPAPQVSCAPASGSMFPLGTTTVNCTAKDAAGNTAAGSFRVNVIAATVTLKLLDSAGNGLAGGTAQYYDGAWKPINGATNSAGILATDVPQSKGNVTFRMTFAYASMDITQNVTSTPTVTFRTTRVVVQLKDSAGNLIPDSAGTGKVQYYTGAWRDFGTTSSGQVSKELLPITYSMSMEYAFGRQQKDGLNPATSPTIVFQTTRAVIQLKDSAGNLIPDSAGTGKAQYYSGAWRDFGTTVGGQVSKELLPVAYSFSMEYASGKQQKDRQNLATSPTVLFQTTRVVVQLKDSAGNLIPDSSGTGKVQYYAGAWRDFGTTSGGQVSKELLPVSYSFSMEFAFGKQQKDNQNVGATPTVGFQTTRVTVQLKDSAGNLIPDSTGIGKVQYYAGAWHNFGTTSGGQVSKELLPVTYSLSIDYAFGHQQKDGLNVATASTVGFQTGKVHSDSGKCTQYYAGAWRPFVQDIELLPVAYPFKFSDGTADTQSTIAPGILNHIH